MDRKTFDVLLNLLHPSLLKQNTPLWDYIPPEKVLALGLDHLAHGNLFDLRNKRIKFPVTEAETIASIETFSEVSDLPNVGQLMAPTLR